MAKKRCELCTNPARMFCESDQASLCWDCDEKVHAANFLVAKHSRTLLCHVCRSPTPWKAAGPKLGPTVSVCRACADDGENRGASSSGRDENDGGCDSPVSESDDGEYYCDSDDCSEEEEEEEEEDGENQVVPWSAASFDSPPAGSCSGSEENASLKRTRNSPFGCEEEDGCCSSEDLESKLRTSELSFWESLGHGRSLLRPLKMRRTRSNESGEIPTEQAAGSEGPSGTAAIVEKLRRFQHEIVTDEEHTSATIQGHGRLPTG